MRKIELYLPEVTAKEALRRLEDFPTLVAISVTACEHPLDQWHLTLIVPDIAYNLAVSLMEEAGAVEHGVLISSRVESIKGERAEHIKRALGSRESEAIAWEESLQALEREGRPSPVFMLFVVIGSLIALCGLVVGSIPILIGAMVIPPALSSLVLVPMALTLRRPRLAAVALLSSVLTLGVSIASSWLVALLLFRFSVVPDADSFFAAEIVQERSQVGLYAYLVALAAGVAGGVSSSTNRPSQLVGVMIAAAIVPSAATVGLGLSQGDMDVTWGAMRLLVSNVVLIMLGAWGALGALRLAQRWFELRLGGPANRLCRGALPTESNRPKDSDDRP